MQAYPLPLINTQHSARHIPADMILPQKWYNHSAKTDHHWDVGRGMLPKTFAFFRQWCSATWKFCAVSSTINNQDHQQFEDLPQTRLIFEDEETNTTNKSKQQHSRNYGLNHIDKILTMSNIVCTVMCHTISLQQPQPCPFRMFFLPDHAMQLCTGVPHSWFREKHWGGTPALKTRGLHLHKKGDICTTKICCSWPYHLLPLHYYTSLHYILLGPNSNRAELRK